MYRPRLLLNKCQQVAPNYWLIDKAQEHHLIRVLRCKHGNEVEGLERGEKRILIIEEKNGAYFLKGEDKITLVEEAPRLHVLLPLLKSDQFDLCLRLLTELGVTAIYLVNCQRCVPLVDSKQISLKMKRWNKIVEQSSAQCASVHVPKLHAPVDLLKISFEYLPPKRFAAIINEGANALAHVGTAHDVAVAVGPEGGWTSDEESFLLNNNFIPIHLGYRTLRASTAVAVMCSWFKYKRIDGD